jgi:protein-S-isoprenylcysteine O-methyltransferase Ste14
VFAALVIWVAQDFVYSVASVATRTVNISAGTNAMLFWFFAKIVVLTAVLIFVCYKKGERGMGPTRKTCDSFFVSEAKQKTEQVYRSCKESQMKKREKSDWRRYQIISQSTPAMRRIQIVLLVLIIIGLVLLATQKLWVGSVVDFILKNYH